MAEDGGGHLDAMTDQEGTGMTRHKGEILEKSEKPSSPAPASGCKLGNTCGITGEKGLRGTASMVIHNNSALLYVF